MPLQGRTIAITRPKEQCDSLAKAIAAHGGVPLIAPLIAITPLDNQVELVQASTHLAQFALAIFISPNSVEHSLPTLLANQPWPTSLQAAAVGPGTAQSLSQHGITSCLLPDHQRYDSEGLLDRPEFQTDEIKGKQVLLLRGIGGRELLTETLSKRGAKVLAISCYQRSPPPHIAEVFTTAWTHQGIDGILLSSSEGLANLLAALLPQDLTRLSQTPLFVPHHRIAVKAQTAGIQQVVLTPPAEDGMLSGLLAYNWPTPSESI